MKNGRDVGREHLATLEAFVAAGTPAPRGRDGTVNLTELGKLTGIPKSSFYQNPAVRDLIAKMRAPAVVATASEAGPGSAAAASPAVRGDDPKAQRLERRVQALEQQNAVLVAENFELRRQLKDLRLQMGREDMAIETGRRIPKPEAS
jgi:hypothetical protein